MHIAQSWINRMLQKTIIFKSSFSFYRTKANWTTVKFSFLRSNRYLFSYFYDIYNAIDREHLNTNVWNGTNMFYKYFYKQWLKIWKEKTEHKYSFLQVFFLFITFFQIVKFTAWSCSQCFFFVMSNCEHFYIFQRSKYLCWYVKKLIQFLNRKNNYWQLSSDGFKNSSDR